jgi:predicted protein tyrosine phosphatase
MPFIQNCAASDVATGYHDNPGDNAMLIQITDPASWRAKPKHTFKEVYHFEFLDVEEHDHVDDPAMKISDQQAAELVRMLMRAKDQNMNVIVHCFAGICRSGAVCEVGVMMGFDETHHYRQPNLLVKHKMMQVLGWTYDPAEKEDPDAWRQYKTEWDV